MPDDPPAEVRGLPHQPVDDWIRAHAPEVTQGGPWTAEVISGGLSNITYRLHTAAGPVILRRPPLGGVLASAHDMAREFRVISALGPTAVPVPRTVALCTDPEVLGAPFYLMSDVPGAVLRSAEDAAGLTLANRAALGEDLVRVLAGLHALDPAEIGLADYGRPDGYAQRQVRRWTGQWEKSKSRELPVMQELLARLADQVADVPQGPPALLHGDYRLDNTLVTLSDPPRIAAVVDWELSTLGDALADLAIALTYQELGQTGSQALAGPVGRAMTEPGFPSPAEFARRYAELTGADLGPLGFHRALAAMKLGVILEGVHARFAAGHTISAGYEGVENAVPMLAERGLELLEAG